MHAIESDSFCMARARVPDTREKGYNKRRMKGLTSSATQRRLESVFACGIWPSHGWDEFTPEAGDFGCQSPSISHQT